MKYIYDILNLLRNLKLRSIFMSRKKTRNVVFFCNLLIIILSIASIASYFILPFWKVSAAYYMNEQELEEMFITALADDEPTGEPAPTKALMSKTAYMEEGGSDVVDTSEIDMEKVIRESIGEEGVTLTLSLGFESKDILTFMDTKVDAQAAIEQIVNDNASTVVDELNEPLNEISKNIVSEVSKQTLANALRDQVQSALESKEPEVESPEGGAEEGGSVSTPTMAERIDQILEEAEITDSYIEQKADQVVDLLYTEGATVEQVSDTIVNIVDEVMTKLSTVDTETFPEAISAEDKAQIKSTVADALEYISNGGEISIDTAINQALLALLQQSGGSSDATGSAPSVKLTADTANDTPDEQNVKEELKIAVKDMIMDKIPQDLIPTISLVMKIIAGVLFFTFFTWAYLIVKIVVKALAPNNAIRLKLPILLGWLPFLVLYVLPTLALHLLADQIPAGFTLTFYTGAWVSFAVAAFLFVFSIFYGILYRKLRTDKKKAAKKED